ncbi:MAG: DUF4249 family protein, partial [Cyclobacteriaceae bacterium]|nr:DUF4249 family protein [Cyclobacteriaceae bacterium HetDA_MAG_MS6]
IPTGAECVPGQTAELICPSTITQQHIVTLELTRGETDDYFKIEAQGVEESFILEATDCSGCSGPASCWKNHGDIVQEVAIGTSKNIRTASYAFEGFAIPFLGRGRYLAEIQVLSISQAAHDFWNSLKAQTERDEGIFEAPVAATFGNIINDNDANDIAIGFFSAYSVTETKVCVSRVNTPSNATFLQALSAPPQTCLTIHAPATYLPPFEVPGCE